MGPNAAYCPANQQVYYSRQIHKLHPNLAIMTQPHVIDEVMAHEFGHAMQGRTLILQANYYKQRQGDRQSALELGRRSEVQADCFAGAWVGAASTIKDSNGVTFLQPVTDTQVADALSAASAVGDDRIQEATQGQVTPETWTHGSSEMRQRWFTAGYNGGPNACDTFSVSGDQL